MLEKPDFFTSSANSVEQKNELNEKSPEQENHFVRGALMELARRTPETAEAHKAMVAHELARYGASYDEGVSLNENIRRLKILKTLEECSVIEIDDDVIVFDPTKINEWRKALHDKYGLYFKISEFISALDGLKGYSREEFQKNKSNDDNAVPLRDIIAVPESIGALPGFAEKSRNSIANIWDLGRLRDWDAKVKARDGKDDLTLFELYVAATIFGKLHGKRDEQGRLVVYDDTRKQERPFTPNLLKELEGFAPRVSLGGIKGITFNGSPMVFVSKYGQNLLKTGLLKKEDFGVNRGSSTSELFDLEKRRLVSGKTNYVVFKNGRAHSARYYMGRTKVVGTEIPIDDNIFTVKLDPTTAGVIGNRLGTSKLLCTIELFGSDEIEKKREQAAQTYLAKHHKEAPPMELTGRTIFNGSEVEGRVKEYDITKYLPRRDGELVADYGRRINNLQNIDFVVQTSRDFFSAVGIGMHNLPWSEQLILANAIFETPSPEKLKEFAGRYGKNGIRTFLSLDYRKDLGHKIVEMGDALDSKAASEIFAKYGQIIDSAHEVGAYLKENFGEHAAVDDQAVGKIVENLLSRGKDLLVHFSDELRAAKQKGSVLDSESVLRELSDIQTETLLFLSSFKTLKHQGADLDFNVIRDLNFGSTPARSLSPGDVSEMKTMYEKSYADNREMRDDLLSVFEKAITRENTVFYVLRYREKIIGFVRFDDEGNDRLYVGSLNVDPRFTGSAIGDAIIEKTTDVKARMATIDADCSAINLIGAHHIENGFVANSFYDYHNHPAFKIERNDRARYESKLMSKSDIVERYKHRSADDREMVITSSSAKDPAQLRFSLLNEGYVLTRYFQYPNDAKDAPWYCVFERKAAEEVSAQKQQAA